MGKSILHTIRFNKEGAYSIAVTDEAYGNDIFDVSIITCTELDVDNLTHKRESTTGCKADCTQANPSYP